MYAVQRPEIDVPIGEYVSPDGQLKFLVTCPDGDWTIGFDGFPSHTHGSILAELSGQDEVTAVERLLADLIGNVSVIALTRISGELTDVWVTDDPEGALRDCGKYGQAGETIEFRLWNGMPIKI
jgi:hypothetical protein